MSRMNTDAPATLVITNWTRSKASNDPDGGVGSLKEWLEKKAGHPIQSYERQGESLYILINSSDKRSFLRTDGWRWAGIDISITEDSHQQQQQPPPRGPRNQGQPNQGFGRGQQNGFARDNAARNTDLGSRINGGQNNRNGPFQGREHTRELFGNDQRSQPPFSQNTNHNKGTNFPHHNQNAARDSRQQGQNNEPNPVQDVLISVIRKRYNAAEKFLDFSALALEPEIQQAGLASESAEKFFRALFVTCEQKVFETASKRNEMVQSISFKNNSLNSVKEIIAAASTFPRIKNLDLSDNNLQKITDLTWWRRRFNNLEHIILSGNPVDSERTRSEVKSWYRNLKLYNLQDVNAPWVNNPLQSGIIPPQLSASPVPQQLPTEPHPEFPPGSTFGVDTPGKQPDQLLKEQMGLKFSYDTRLKMKWVEECLVSNNFNYDEALQAFGRAVDEGRIPVDAFLQV